MTGNIFTGEFLQWIEADNAGPALTNSFPFDGPTLRSQGCRFLGTSDAPLHQISHRHACVTGTKEVSMQSSNPALLPSMRPITRRSVVAGLALATTPVTFLAAADNAQAQDKQAMPEKSLYERLGGVFAIAAVVNHFSDAVVKNPIVGEKSKNLQLQEWHTKNLGRLPGLKFMRTLWVLQCFGWTLPVYGHQARHDAARPRRGPSGPAHLPRRI